MSIWGGGYAAALGPTIHQDFVTGTPTPKIQDITRPTFRAAYGGMGQRNTQLLAKLQAKAKAGELSAKDQTKLDELTALSQDAQHQGGTVQQGLDAQLKYLPQFDALMLKELQSAAPAINQLYLDQQKQFGPQMAALENQTMHAQNPDYYSARDALGQQVMQGIGQGLTPQQLQFFRNQSMQSQAAKGLQDSPLGSSQEAMYLTQMNMAQQQQNTLNAQNFLNAYQRQGMQQFQLPTNALGLGLAGGSLNPLGPGDLMGIQTNLTGLNFAQNLAGQNQMGQGIAAGGLAGMQMANYYRNQNTTSPQPMGAGNQYSTLPMDPSYGGYGDSGSSAMSYDPNNINAGSAYGGMQA